MIGLGMMDSRYPDFVYCESGRRLDAKAREFVWAHMEATRVEDAALAALPVESILDYLPEDHRLRRVS